MRNVEFRQLLDEKNVVRVFFEIEQNNVLRFVAQLECRFNGEWLPIVRYDTAHHFAHRDVLHPFLETQKTEMAVQDYNEGLTLAIKDLQKNWEFYRGRYEEWLKQRKK